MFSCEYCGIFKITCFEEHLRTAASIRYYFDTINLTQSDFCTAYSFKIHVSERKYKNNLKNRESQKNFTILTYITKSSGFTKIFKVKICAFFKSALSPRNKDAGPVTRDHVNSSQIRNETLLQL